VENPILQETELGEFLSPTEKKNYNQDNRKKFGAQSSMALVPFSEMGH
jgi:hypothetical protein